MNLRAQNWLNSLDVGTPDTDGWLAICPCGDSAEVEVRAELARMGYATEDHVGQVCVQHTPPPPTSPPLRISKLALRRALRAASLEPAFDAALSSNAAWAADWADATELRSDDPILQAALPALAKAAGMTVGQAQTLLESAAISE